MHRFAQLPKSTEDGKAVYATLSYWILCACPFGVAYIVRQINLNMLFLTLRGRPDSGGRPSSQAELQENKDTFNDSHWSKRRFDTPSSPSWPIRSFILCIISSSLSLADILRLGCTKALVLFSWTWIFSWVRSYWNTDLVSFIIRRTWRFRSIFRLKFMIDTLACTGVQIPRSCYGVTS